MMKRILCLAMTVVMVLGASLTVNAAELENSKSWTVRYSGGSDLVTELGEGQSSLSLSFSDIEPGESISLEAKIVNDTNKRTDWYLSNDIVKAFEKVKDSVVAQGGAYTYLLTYHGPENAEAVAIYNSSEVGGTDETNGDGLGEMKLHEAGEYIYLDRLDPKEEAYVRLYVKLNGETLTDGYQGQNAELTLNFAVEKINEGTIRKEITKINKETVVTSVPNKVVIVPTGDNAQVVLFSSLAMASGLVLIAVAVKMSIKKRSEKGEV